MDFKTNIVQDATLPGVLKKSLIYFKRSSVHSSSAYNINSDKNKVSTPSKKSCVSTRSFPENFTLYHHVGNGTTHLSLLSLCTEFDKNKFQPFHVKVEHGSQDLTNFCFLQNEMSKSYAIYFSLDECAKIAPIQLLVNFLKQKSILSFLFVPCAHDILLDFFASEHTLSKIARGSMNPLTVLKGSHPWNYSNHTNPVIKCNHKYFKHLLSKNFQTCAQNFFTFDQLKSFVSE